MYYGKLHYDGEPHYVEIVRLIERGDSIIIELRTTWDDGNVWCGEALLQKKDGYFESEPFFTKNQTNQTASESSRITIRITGRAAEIITVEGEWKENGEKYRFSGDLTAASSTGGAS